MFAFSPNRPELPASLAASIRPVAMAASRQIPVGAPWSTLLPDGGLRRGSTIVINSDAGAGALSVAFSVVAHPTSKGHWAALVGVDDPGVVAMAEFGVSLAHVLFLPRPRDAWVEATADLIDGIDLVVVRPPSRPAHGAARRLMARARERRAVLIVVSEPRSAWPVPVDVMIDITEADWRTDAMLRERVITTRVSGRGAARRGDDVRLLLPTTCGTVSRP